MFLLSEVLIVFVVSIDNSPIIRIPFYTDIRI